MRWYLKRGPHLVFTNPPVLLVVEETAEPRRGFTIQVRDRKQAREYLPMLKQAVADLDKVRMSVVQDPRTFDAAEACDG